MKKVSKISKRKEEHLEICLEKDIESSVSAGFERIDIIHQALPEIDFTKIDISTSILGKYLTAPLLISSMTGGSPKGEKLNAILAEMAEHHQIAMGLGSQRAAIEDESLSASFKIRKYAPNIFLFANLGAVQLNYGYGLNEIQRAIDMIEADALFLHLNPLQEALQPEGNTNFSGLLPKIEALCKQIETPVFIKEVGCGINANLAKTLIDVGVAGIDCAGLGGTSWALVEAERQTDEDLEDFAKSFGNLGIPTVDCLLDYRKNEIECPIIASGGLRSGLDVFKSLALGANLAGMALPFIKAANAGSDAIHQLIERIVLELKIAMFNTGCQNISDISFSKIVVKE